MQTKPSHFAIEHIIITAGSSLMILAYGLSFFSMFEVQVLRFITVAAVITSFYLVARYRHHILRTVAFWILLVFAAVAFTQGIMSVPTTTDAHNYHIPRAIFWLQNRSIFQSVIHTSHDFMGPIPSILLSLMYSLTNTDLLLFVPQWLSYIAIFFLIDRLGKLLAYSSKQVQTAQLLSLSIPIATLQASSVQSDLLVAVFVLVSVIFAIRYIKENSQLFLVLCTLSVFVGFLTKATMVIYAVIPVGLLGWHFLQHPQRRFSMVKAGVIGCLLGILICLPHFLSNKRLFHSYLGTSYTIDGQSIPFTVNSVTFAGSIENVYRNIFMHFPILGLAPTMDHWVDRLKPLGISIDLSQTSWFNSEFLHQRVPIPQEDIAPAPLQMIGIGTAILVVFQRKVRTLTPHIQLLVASSMAFIVFCIILRWQPYHIRQQLSILFVLIVSGMGVLPLSRNATKVLCAFSVIVGLIVMVSNVSRPIISYRPILSKIAFAIPDGFMPPESVLKGRNDANYFLSRPYWQSAYEEMASYVHDQGVRRVGFTGREGYIYPFMHAAATEGILVTPAGDQSAPVQVIAGLREDQQFEKANHCVETANANKVICVYFNP